MNDYFDEINTNHWISKYKPRSVKDFLGCKTQIRQIMEWLNKYEENALKMRGTNKKKISKLKIKDDDNEGETTELVGDVITEDNNVSAIKKKKDNKDIGNHSCIIVTGKHGTGKTCMVTSILIDAGYDIKTIDFSKINSMKNIDDFVEKTMKGVNIYNIISGKKKKKIAVIIDKLESIVSPTEKKFILSVFKKNEIEWNFPIIFISDNKHTKTINDIKNYTFEIKLSEPNDENMMNLLVKICSNEKMRLYDVEVANNIIAYSQNDYRRLVSTLQDIKCIYNKKIFTQEDFDEYSLLSKKKDMDYDIFDAAKHLIYGYNDIDKALRLYDTEKTLIPLMIQQNYISCLQQGKTKDTNLLISDISQSLAKGDIIENYIYSDQNWALQEVQGFLSCVYPSYKLTQSLNKGKTNPDKITAYNIHFPLDLNRTSIKKINKKNVINADKIFKNMDITDYIYINKIVRGFVETGNEKQCKELFSGYDCTMANIESVIKINKIESTKYSIPTSIKNKMGIEK